jgi:hypothetical protein
MNWLIVLIDTDEGHVMLTREIEIVWIATKKAA